MRGMSRIVVHMAREPRTVFWGKYRMWMRGAGMHGTAEGTKLLRPQLPPPLLVKPRTRARRTL